MGLDFEGGFYGGWENDGGKVETFNIVNLSSFKVFLRLNVIRNNNNFNGTFELFD